MPRGVVGARLAAEEWHGEGGSMYKLGRKALIQKRYGHMEER